MARPQNNHHLYIGRAGHLAAMAECLSRGWNVAIPEVDVGEDIFVVEDESSNMLKVQVKTATGKKYSKGFSCQFNIPLRQLNDTSQKGNDLRFIFVTRYSKKWQPYIIMTRKELLDKHQLEHIGTLTSNGDVKLTLYFIYDVQKNEITNVECGTQRGFSGKGIPKPELTAYLDKWDIFFKIRIADGN